MVCKRCPEGRFNPIDRYSPDSMDECRSHYHKPVTDDMHVILYLPGNNTDPAVYYCDYLNRWVSVDKSMFCRHSYYPCRCIYVGDMCFAEDLLPGKTEYGITRASKRQNLSLGFLTKPYSNQSPLATETS